jgi:hypothetical protein
MSRRGDPDTAGTAGEPEGPAFAAPWEATAFALKAHLVATGIVDAGRFAALLGEELRKDHHARDEGTAYFVAFVAALERAIADIAPPAALAAEREAWRAAARATPHGRPITLQRG